MTTEVEMNELCDADKAICDPNIQKKRGEVIILSCDHRDIINGACEDCGYDIL